jgi:hypothetical protein
MGIVARCGERWTLAGVLGIAALTVDVGLREGAAAIALPVAGVWGVWLVSAMAARSRLVLRVLAHWSSFAGTFALLFPAALAARTGGADPPMFGDGSRSTRSALLSC